MSKLHKNMVLTCRNNNNVKEKLIRVIWINEESNYIYYVNMMGNTSMPVYMSLDDAKNGLDFGELIEVNDRYEKYIDESKIPDKYKNIRDENWKVVDYLWYGDATEILFKYSRNGRIEEAVDRFNIPKLKIMRILSRFWQRGMNKNALLPDYCNSGAAGKRRKAGDKKRGRPKKLNVYENSGIGVNITDDIEKCIVTSINLYYRTSKKKSLMETYNLMLKDYFSDRYYIEGKLHISVWDKDRIPQYNQFYYIYKKYYSDEKLDYISRYGEKHYNLKKRPLLGNFNSRAFGPGYRYEIDATVADVYIVSEINKDKIIGRPVVYIVIDQYSRLITGTYVGLEGPSWIGAMMALDNVVADKIEFCKKYDIDITEEDWPQSYLPEVILADRGEVEGKNIENLINNLNVRVEDTPPYRGDLKGIVERYFRTTNDKIKRTTPGAIQKEYRERGEKDYRLKAVLGLKQITTLILLGVIHHNKSVINGFDRDLGLIQNDIPPIPIEMWKWGIKNRKCSFINRNRDIIRLNLLPKGKALLTREGIKVNRKMFYSCSEAIKENWFIDSTKKNIEFVYDPRNTEFIYIPKNNSSEFIKCSLLEKSEKFIEYTLEEVEFQLDLEAELLESKKNIKNQNNINLEQVIEDVINKSIVNTPEQIKTSDKARIKGIRENRKFEKEEIRQQEYFELGKLKQTDSKVLNIPADKNEDFYLEEKISMLKQKRDEKIKNED